MTKTTWNALSARVGRNDLPYVLGKAALLDEVLTDPEEIAKGIADAWSAAEWPQQCLDAEVWEILFEKTGFIEDGEIKDPEAVIPENLVLYRGAVAEHMRGMSWTDDLDRARWFANRFAASRGAGNVYRLSVTPGFILAHLTGRGEGEWVIATSELEDEEFTLVEVVGDLLTIDHIIYPKTD